MFASEPDINFSDERYPHKLMAMIHLRLFCQK
jgi:hypothetical protein